MSQIDHSKISNKRTRIIKYSIIFIISLALVWFLLTRITFEDVKTVLSKVQPIYIVIGIVIYIFAYLFRALRFHILLGRKVRVKDLIVIVSVHNLMNKILPARTGELSFIYLLKKYDINLEERIATLVIARIFDFIMIACFFLFSVLFLRDLPTIVAGAFWIIAICLLILVILLGSLLYRGESFKKYIGGIAIQLRIDRFKITNKILKIVEDTILSFKIIRSRKIIAKTGALTCIIWILMFILYFMYTQAFHIELGMFEIVVIVSFMALLPLLPFYAVGGFGTTEVTITIFLVAFGVDEKIAIVTSFGIHLIAIMYTVILGLIGSAILGLKKRRKGSKGPSKA